ncbi:Alpha-1,2-mannosidase, putative [Hondaea fermentalgiana]|uniref:Alpha-1,2-mannosidase, putative n=1 Tax=Hondaea fermentalgiana TaxID=2315210 RepID=A0A2R5G6J3_9STRA|nr:Alpha-1,2-mannosidase, putative [Hondaea fermentalgiana]|eukprot:GBG26145.1 Alpha-1,2-mannosidase, putative [Hondaea fermentalgiana]
MGSGPASMAFSRGNTLPLMALPRSMTHWAVQTTSTMLTSLFFNPESVTFAGIRCTHQPSPWIGDYGQMLITPGVENLGSPVYDPEGGTEMRPYILNTTMLNMCSSESCVRLEFVPSAHGGFLRARFPRGLGAAEQSLTFKVAHGSFITMNDASGFLGYSTTNRGGVVAPDIFKHHYAAKLEFLGDAGVPMNLQTNTVCGTSSTTSNGDLCTARVTWKNENMKSDVVVQVRLGTSFISPDQAKISLERELPASMSLENARDNARNAWNKMLGRVRVSGTPSSSFPHDKDTATRLLYTNMYRALLFPRSLGEVDASGRTVHFSPFDPKGGVRDGAVMVDIGFWDAYRTVFPMLHLIFPEVAKEVLEGFVNSTAEAEGRVVQWASPGPRNSMVGTMSDVSLAEGIVNGALKGDVAKTAYASLLKNAFDGSGSNSRGTELDTYDKLGYVPERTALSLNYKLADYAISRAALVMNDASVATRLEARSKNWARLFDNSTLYFRAPNKDGRFADQFDPYLWHLEDYTEGSAAQYRFYVPHDAANLRRVFAALKGEGSLCEYLKGLLTAPSTFHMANVIHEATEMAANCVGLYAHNNQPSHHILYMFAHSECPLEGQRWIEHTLGHQYDLRGYAGDEDNGEEASWYILSSLGLYALVPSSGTYQVGAGPIFESVEIRRPAEFGGTLRVSRRSGHSPFRSVRFDGKTHDLTSGAVALDYSALLRGGSVEFL